MNHKQHKEKPGTDRTASQAPHRQPEREANAPREITPSRTREKVILEQERQHSSQSFFKEQGNQQTNHRAAQQSDILHHFTQAQAFDRRFRLRHVLSQEHKPVDCRGNQEERELGLPRPTASEQGPGETSENEAGWPTRMQNIQVMRAVVREQRRHQRIGHGFERAIRHGEDERPQVENHVSAFLGHPFGGAEGDNRRKHMERKCSDDQFSIADLVAKQPANNDPETESGETGAVDVTELSGGKPEISTPIGKDATTDAKADARSQNGRKPGPQQSSRVGCYAVLSDVHNLLFGLLSLGGRLNYVPQTLACRIPTDIPTAQAS